LKATVFQTDLIDYDGFNSVRFETFMNCKEPPAGTAVGAGSLPGSGARVEIEVVAFLPSSGS
jgi:enamine deaminase RidA (YjgF/YER057c/UK114 family)